MGNRALSLEVKWPEREADHSAPSSAEVKNAWSYTSTPQYVFMAWYLVKHRDKGFTNNFKSRCVEEKKNARNEIVRIDITESIAKLQLTGNVLLYYFARSYVLVTQIEFLSPTTQASKSLHPKWVKILRWGLFSSESSHSLIIHEIILHVVNFFPQKPFLLELKKS
jgi:hypothetical protein